MYLTEAAEQGKGPRAMPTMLVYMVCSLLPAVLLGLGEQPVPEAVQNEPIFEVWHDRCRIGCTQTLGNVASVESPILVLHCQVPNC